MFFQGKGRGVRVTTEAFNQKFDKMVPSDLITDVRIARISEPKMSEKDGRTFQTIWFFQGGYNRHVMCYKDDVPEMFADCKVGDVVNLDVTKMSFNSYKAVGWEMKEVAKPGATLEPGTSGISQEQYQAVLKQLEDLRLQLLDKQTAPDPAPSAPAGE